MAPGDERLAYGTEETAQLLGMSERTVRQMCQSGALKARKYGTRWVIPRRAVLAWLEGDDEQVASAAIPTPTVDRLRFKLLQ